VLTVFLVVRHRGSKSNRRCDNNVGRAALGGFIHLHNLSFITNIHDVLKRRGRKVQTGEGGTRKCGSFAMADNYEHYEAAPQAATIYSTLRQGLPLK
jgi:hypothetical protein